MMLLYSKVNLKNIIYYSRLIKSYDHGFYMQYLTNFREVLDSYDFFICDIWGVVRSENGNVFEGVLELLSEIQQKNKKLVFLSNVPVRKENCKEILREIGITNDYYTDVHTSGEETRLLLHEKTLDFGKKYFVIDDTRKLLDGLDFEESNLDDADFVLGSGIKHRFDLSFYDEIIAKIIERKIPYICPNPDIVVVTGDGERLFCPGAIAEKYEKANGEVFYVGKPYHYVYERIFKNFNVKDKSRVLIIGDSLNTDIRGAEKLQIDSVLVVRSGIHSQDVVRNGSIEMNLLNNLCDKLSVFPKYVIDYFI